MKKILITENAPSAIGPYSQGVLSSGEIIFVSGQMPINPKTGAIESQSITLQARQVLSNVGAILESAGLSYESVVKTTCFITNMGDFTEFNKVYEEFFKGNYPARSCVAVKELPKQSLCEVEVIAIRES